MGPVGVSGTYTVSETVMPCIQTFDLPFSSSTAKMLAGPRGTLVLNVPMTRSISMRTRLLSAFLRWLDNYFRATPEERMADEYNAYWN